MNLKIALVYINRDINVGRGVGYIAGAIIDAGYKVDLIDSFYTPVNKIVELIVHGNYEILMISAMTINFPDALTLISSVKKRKQIPILVGGVHPTILGDRFSRRTRI